MTLLAVLTDLFIMACFSSWKTSSASTTPENTDISIKAILRQIVLGAFMVATIDIKPITVPTTQPAIDSWGAVLKNFTLCCNSAASFIPSISKDALTAFTGNAEP